MNIVEMRQALADAKLEARNLLNENKVEEAEAKMAEVRNLEKSIKLAEELEAREMEDLKNQEERNEGVEDMEKRDIELSVEEKELRSFEAFVRGEERALTKADNGAIIPTTIANRIIEKVKELAPIYSMATIYNVGGKLSIPVASTRDAITASYQAAEFAEFVESTTGFTTIDLNGYVIGTITKVSKSLLNNAGFDITSYVVNKVAESIAEFLEKELIVGKTKIKGLTTTTNTIANTSDGVLTAEDFVDAQCAIPQSSVAGAVFIINKKTLSLAKKLTLDNGEFILNRDFTNAYGMTILGNRVIVSDSVEDGVVYYGNIAKGLAVKVAQNVELQTLTEKYATQHSIGYLASVEVDGAVVDPQHIVKVTF